MIIAEAGINHNGDRQLAFRLVDAAIEAGADAIKFQTFWDIGRLDKYELRKETYIDLKDYCDKKGIMFLSTPHNMDAIDFVDRIVSIHKIASPHLTNKEFVKKVDSKNKPILLSTGSFINDDGMATDEEIETTLSWINNDVTLLHCISKYPSPSSYKRIHELEKFGYPVGLSDHNKNIYVPTGLPVYEKHFMLPNIECIDQEVSMIPIMFKEMVKWLKSS